MKLKTESSTPVYMKIRQSIFGRFLQLGYSNNCIPSEKELCKLYDVSRSTIRKALKEIIDEGYLIPHPGKGTFINLDRLKNSFYPKATQIGYISGSGKTSFYSLSDGNILCGAMNYLHEQGTLFQMINLINTGQKAVDELIEFTGIKGLLWFNPSIEHYETIRQAEKAGLPIVTMYKSSEEFDWIGIDQFEVGRLAAEYLIQKGCRRVIETYVENNEEAQDRIAGIAHAFKEHNIEYDGRLRLYDEMSITNELEKIISYGVEFDGIFAMGCFLSNILETLNKKNNKIQQDVNIVSVYSSGYKFIGDNSIAAIKLPYKECGEIAAQRLLEKITNPNTEKIVIKLKPILYNNTDH